jgi:predicted PurR-regulated permease PerM
MWSDKIPEWISHILVVLFVLTVLALHLTSAAVAGFLVYTLSLRLKSLLERWGTGAYARRGALAIVIFGVALAVYAAALGIWEFAKSRHGMAGLSTELSDGLERLRASMPAWADAYIPDSVDSAKIAVVDALKKYSADLSAVGKGTVRLFAHVLIGVVVGAMLAWGEFGPASSYRPLSRELLGRFSSLRLAFEQEVFSQIQISLLNTILTAAYLKILPPLAGVHLPFTNALIGFAFVAGLIPIFGNLVSNGVIVLISLGASVHAAIASLVFLALIHKLEYFANARIVGRNIQAKAWEIIIAMVAMESLFGITGVAVAPILYAYAKAELGRAGLIGRRLREG